MSQCFINCDANFIEWHRVEVQIRSSWEKKLIVWLFVNKFFIMFRLRTYCWVIWVTWSWQISGWRASWPTRLANGTPSWAHPSGWRRRSSNSQVHRALSLHVLHVVVLKHIVALWFGCSGTLFNLHNPSLSISSVFLFLCIFCLSVFFFSLVSVFLSLPLRLFVSVFYPLSLLCHSIS